MTDVSILVSCFRAEPYLESFLRNVARQSILPSCEVVLVHNAPSPAELAVVESFRQEHGERLRHIVVESPEPLPRSWNRAMAAASSDVVAMWNVDDVRTDASLERQRAVLDADPACVAAYGDFVIVGQFGATDGTVITAPAFDRARFTTDHNVGPFPMWRRSACERAGLFDEQLLVAADYDLFIRLAFNGVMGKADGLLGYFLYAGAGLSSRANTLLPVERTVVEQRYGMLGRLDYRYYRAALAYRRYEVHFRDAWHAVDELVPSYERVMRRRRRSRVPGYLGFAIRRLRHLAGASLRAVRARRRPV